MELKELKNYIRIDYDSDDELLKLLIYTSDIYLRGAVNNWDALIDENSKHYQMAKVLQMALIGEMYDNRNYNDEKLTIKNNIINTIIFQLNLVGGNYD